MSDLIEDLRRTVEGLRRGDLSLEALEAACGTAGELHERLVVLRHKAREQRHAKAASAGPRHATPPAEPAAPQGPPPIKLDTRPATPRQTTLDEAIAEQQGIAEELPHSAAPAAATQQASVAEKLEHAPIADLAKAISLSDKFWFTKELFGGDAAAYGQAMAALNAAGSLQAAEDWLRKEVLPKLKSEPDAAALEAFRELLARRFA